MIMYTVHIDTHERIYCERNIMRGAGIEMPREISK
jgi:hypothetical protein